MKQLLYLAAALLAAAACSREPVIPDEPETGKILLTDVTLVAGMPETRTELGISPQLPLWSAQDAIDVVRIGSPEYDDYNYLIVHPFFSDDLQEAADWASFHNGTDDALEFGETYWAAYPRGYDDYLGEWKGVEFSGVTNEEYHSYLEFTLPQEQYPTPTSFDKDADLLISKPFTIEDGNYDDNTKKATVSLEFTRMNAIVKVVLKDKTNNGQGGLLNGQIVEKVVLGYLDTELENISYAPATRVKMDDGDGDYTTLAGDIRVDLGEDGSFLYDIDNFGGNGVAAIYTSDTEYAIGQTGAATYLVVNPCILKNEEDEQGVTGLRVLVETEDMIIERFVDLPADGLALQPSRMTTLNIGLYDDGKNNTHIHDRGISFMTYDKRGCLVSTKSLEVGYGENVELMIALYGMNTSNVDINDFEFGPQESDVIGLVDYSSGFYGHMVERLYLHGIKLGADTFTVSIDVDDVTYSATLPVTVTLGENGRSLDGNYGDDNKPGGGINSGNTVIVEGEL